MTQYYTNAPESYDYGYVRTVDPSVMTFKRGLNRVWRLIEVSDQKRFESFQLPRYQSGLCQAFAVGSEQAAYLLERYTGEKESL